MELTAEILAFLIAVAFISGTIDAMAGGGGLLTIPALMAVGIPPVAAIATNKLQSAFGTASACIAYWRGGHIDLRRFAIPAAGAFLGSTAGAFTVQRVDPTFLTAFVPVLLILMALIAAPQAWKAWQALRGVQTEQEHAYYLANAETRFAYGALYLGLAGFLAVMCHQLHEELPRAY